MNNLNDSAQITRSGKFFIFFAIFAFLAWKAASPLLTDIMWAIMLAFLSAPINKLIHKKLLHGRFETLAAALTLIFIILVLIIPVIIIIAEMTSDAAEISGYLYDLVRNIRKAALDGSGQQMVRSYLPEWVIPYLPDTLDVNSLASSAQNAAMYTGRFLTQATPKIISIGSGALLNMLITLMITFFFIRDGYKIFQGLKPYVPLPEADKNDFYKEITCRMNSVIFGMMMTVAIQAISCSVGWWFVGLQNALFFGVIMFLVGMFPTGTAVVWVPGSIYLAVCGNYTGAVIMLVWGCAVVGITDSFIRPLLIARAGGSAKSSTLLITIGLFGGVMAFGFLGIFIGPLVLMLFQSVCEIYKKYNCNTESK